MGDKTASSVYDFEAVDIRGQKKALSAYSGKVLLIANVATQCGLTKNNYEQLSDFVTKYYDQGLRILLFPCNQFGKQEPGEAGEIDAFACHYNAKFDMFGKVLVNSKDAHPLFKYLKAECKGFLVDAIKWNFTKFLVDRHGKPVARFGPTEEPVSFEKRVQAALEQP